MTKKENTAVEATIDEFDFFSKPANVEPTSKAIFFISDEGGVHKSTGAIAFATIARKIGRTVDLWLCDKDHIQPMEHFGKRSATGDLLPMDQQLPSDCGYFDIRTKGHELVDKLRSNAKLKLFDMPAASIDELTKYFSSIVEFLSAFEKTNTEIVFAVPYLNIEKSLRSVQKLKRMFSGVNPNVKITFLLILSYSKMTNVEQTLDSLNSDADVLYLKRNHTFHVGHIKTMFNANFNEVIDPIEGKTVFDWFEILNSRKLSMYHEVILEGFLKEWIATVKLIA